LGNWIIAALGASIIYGLTNNLDSHLVARRLPGLRSFLLAISVVMLVLILPFMFIFPLPGGVGGGILASILISALMRAAAIVLMIFALKSEEVVGVVPLIYAYPVFVGIAAVPLLGETLNVGQWLAIFIVVIGAIIVAIRPRGNGKGRWLGKNFPLLITAAVLFAGADLSAKYALEEIPSFTLYWISMLTLVVVSFCISLRPEVIKSLKKIENPRQAAVLVVLNEGLILGASMLSFWAMKNGPISLVSTILASRPVFVFGAAIVLSRLFPGFVYWQSNRRILGYKFIAILFIVAGIAIIYLV